MTPDPAAAHDDRDRATADEAASIPPATRDDIPVSWDERTIPTTFLDYARATVHAKCAGIAEEDARRAPLPGSPLMTISGLVSHLRWVEYYWFGVHLLGGETTVRGSRRIPIARCGSPSGYRSASCSASTKPAARSADPFHRNEGTARHNGHIGILRELADGIVDR